MRDAFAGLALTLAASLSLIGAGVWIGASLNCDCRREELRFDELEYTRTYLDEEDAVLLASDISKAIKESLKEAAIALDSCVADCQDEELAFDLAYAVTKASEETLDDAIEALHACEESPAWKGSICCFDEEDAVLIIDAALRASNATLVDAAEALDSCVTDCQDETDAFDVAYAATEAFEDTLADTIQAL